MEITCINETLPGRQQHHHSFITFIIIIIIMGDFVFLSLVVVVLAGGAVGGVGAQTVGYENPACDGKNVIVHLFEWKWTDIALECERFLSQAGYCGVQTSPPNEHAMITSDYPYPWWQRYQPVSYKLESRSGTEAEFIDMVQRCNAVGVRIFADAVVNHMAALGRQGVGYGGTTFNGDNHDFPGVPFTSEHFTPREICPSGDGMVNNYGDPYNVRNCYLVALTDLYGALPYVRQKVAEYFTNLVNIGVAGFRIDAAKHMWPEDLLEMMTLTPDLNTDQGFPANTRPFFFHEVIDRDDGAVTVQEYYGMGRVTEFRYSQKIAWGIQDIGQLGGVYDPGWGMADPDKAFIFVDNHDNQRGHGGAGDTLTYKYPKDYRLGVAFTLAQPYGFTRHMSSYYFDDDTDAGPPHHSDYSTSNVVINENNECEGGWVCEHRWPSIYKIVRFSNAVADTGHAEWLNYYNDGNVVAFSRGNKGFFAMVKYGTVSQTFQTGMPAGTYEEVVSCQSVTVNGDGTALVSITNEEEPVFAICEGCDCSEPPTVTATPDPDRTTTTTTTTQGPTLPPITEGIHRTVVFIQKQTNDGQDLFVRGGIDGAQRPGCLGRRPRRRCRLGRRRARGCRRGQRRGRSRCRSRGRCRGRKKGRGKTRRRRCRGGSGGRRGCTSDTETDPCAIDITTNSLGTTSHYDKYNSWRVGDTKLDWNGAQTAQGSYSGQVASGTPLAWTSNSQGSPGYQDLNTFGDHYWMVDMDMDCSQAEDGWFEVKGFLTNAANGWEADINQMESCSGSAGGQVPYTSSNHLARCGFLNVFTFDSSSCYVDSLP
ncbi:hypothetical protein Pcinc_040753 [Petrolisthes cinctipes]|uniref:Alpha-amylase n=1 Tax=Petrolisthes cinctipes TaxID=88211 RepID=A0AAE1EHM7_PETCI|nr:hypothetical protein Pcinc_040753 [Petrolisthes cinctipes]